MKQHGPFKEIVLRDNIFHRQLNILIGGSIEELVKLANEELDTEVEGNETSDGCHFSVVKRGYIFRFIWLPEFKFSPYSIGVLNHELIHFTFSSLTDLQVKIEKESDEVFAYFHQSYFPRALEELQKLCSCAKM